MRKRLAPATGLALGALFALPAAAGASHDPSGPPVGEDFVVRSFPAPGAFLTIDAHSGPSGENPRGEVRAVSRLGAETGRVTCLSVTVNRATVGVAFPTVGGGFFFVEDNDGGGEDRFTGAGTPTGEAPSVCPTNPPRPLDPILNGDITVHDAPALPTSKEQCKNAGWRNFPGFKNEGDCVSFVATGGKNDSGQNEPAPAG
jgi:hypothetical protein